MIIPLIFMILEPNIKRENNESEKKNSDPDVSNIEVRATADTMTRRSVDDQIQLSYIG
jgi:hypothetical protein